MFPNDLLHSIETSGLIAVVIIDREEDALPLGRALLQGGVTVLELTLRTPAALGAIARLTDRLPELLTGAGTVLTAEQVGEVKAAGARFGVAPGLNPTVLRAAKEAELPFAPGVMTPSEIEVAVEHGCRLLKFFPAETVGGASALKSISAPYAHLGLRFIPLGGLGVEQVSGYLKTPGVAALGGSWIAPRDLIAAGAWSTITDRAAEAIAAIRQSRCL